MSTDHKTATVPSGPAIVNFRASPDLVRDYRKIVEAEERTLSQALRLHMAERVADARDENGELKVAA